MKKSWIFEKISKIDKSFIHIHQEKKKKTQINRMNKFLETYNQQRLSNHEEKTNY